MREKMKWGKPNNEKGWHGRGTERMKREEGDRDTFTQYFTKYCEILWNIKFLQNQQQRPQYNILMSQ